jgi:NAD(P)-dependent dehydrogenase (short-subunit alcohol dehydrogenase family)
MAQHTVIIGGTAGIGLATARQLVEEGHRVTVAGRDAERLKQALAALADNGSTNLAGPTASTEHAGSTDFSNSASPVSARPATPAQGRLASMTDRASLDALFEELGAIDNLVVTAPGTGCPGTLAELDLATLDEAFSTKFLGTAHAIQAALPYLSKQGSITLVSAGSAQAPMPGTAGLAAVNGAVEVLVPTLALELAPIRVNCVAPGVVDTDWWDRVVAPEQRADVLAGFNARTPVGRIGRPEDIADVIAMLVRNGFMTGTVIPVDGGWRLKA